MFITTGLASMSASSFTGIPLFPGIHRMVVGPGRALSSDLRLWSTGDRRSIALSSSLHVLFVLLQTALFIAYHIFLMCNIRTNMHMYTHFCEKTACVRSIPVYSQH